MPFLLYFFLYSVERVLIQRCSSIVADLTSQTQHETMFLHKSSTLHIGFTSLATSVMHSEKTQSLLSCGLLSAVVVILWWLEDKRSMNDFTFWLSLSLSETWSWTRQSTYLDQSSTKLRSKYVLRPMRVDLSPRLGGTHSGQSTPPLLSSSHSPSFFPPAGTV